MPNINRVRLEICETEYIVTSEEPESYMLELGAQLDRDMRTLMNNDSRISTTMAAVLAALNNADIARKATDAADNLRAQMKAVSYTHLSLPVYGHPPDLLLSLTAYGAWPSNISG